MSAEVLRRAASLMRERAGAATPGPWFVYNDEPWAGDEQVAIDYDAGRITDVEYDEAPNQPGSLFHGDVVHHPNATHIASWHPAVALAVADWLEVTADDVGSSTLAFKAALSFARIYLGES